MSQCVYNLRMNFVLSIINKWLCLHLCHRYASDSTLRMAGVKPLYLTYASHIPCYTAGLGHGRKCVPLTGKEQIRLRRLTSIRSVVKYSG